MFKYLKYILLFLIFFTGAVAVQAQGPYGNEWINYDQTYHKLKVVNTGLHRLDYADLEGLGLKDVNPKNLQLYRRGKEVAIYVAGQADGKLDTQDFIEFYGERNDGALDAELYKDPADQIHQFYSLYTDTAAYFLTVAPTPGKRMVEQNPAVNGKTPEPYHLQKAVTVNVDRFNFGRVSEDGLQAKMSWMDAGEGYMSNYRIGSWTYEVTGVKNLASIGPNPVLEFATSGAYQEYHTFDVNVIMPTGSARKLDTYRYDKFDYKVDRKEVLASDINASGSIKIQIVPVSTPGKGNAISFSYGEITYPQLPLFVGDQFIFYSDSTRSGSPYYELKNTPTSVVAYNVTDPYNAVRISGHAGITGKGFVVQNNNITHKILLANTNKPLKPGKQIKGFRFRKINPADHNYIIITNKILLRAIEGSELTAPEQYAAYRASQAGGAYDTLLLEMNQIVDQFHYGEFSSNSIRRLMQFMGTSPNPKHLFLIGKGVKYAGADMPGYLGGKFSYYHIGARNTKAYELDLVPTGISPSSDVFFTADYRNGSFVPAVPTGRLAATTPDDIINYLNKVKEYEAQPAGQAWQKNILQLGGGATAQQIAGIGRLLTDLKKTAEGPFLGANVIEKYRQNVSQAVESIDVSKEVNNGLSLMTFYGHSSTNTNDLDIGLASSPVNGYNNKGKYPVILMNGCNVGDAFIPNYRSFGEDWTLTPDKGAIAFIAHLDAGGGINNLGNPGYLDLYSKIFYDAAFTDPELYGKSIGQIQQKVIEWTYRSKPVDAVLAMVMQMALQGDPAVRLYSPAKPDYLVRNDGLSIVGNGIEGINAETKTFNVIVKAENLGKALPESVSISIRRTLADNTIIQYNPIKVDSVYRMREVVLPVDNTDINALGLNTFEVKIDSPNEFDELDETNNTATIQYFFPVNGLFALSPAEYGIVNKKDVTLKAQATKLDETRDGYVFEVDTTHHFNSVAKRSYSASNSLIGSVDVDLSAMGNFSDSTVFFWRTRFKNYTAGEDTIWATSSFRMINGASKGWSQSHAGQFAKANTDKLVLKENKPHFQFIPQKSEIIIKTAGGNNFKIPPHGLFVDGKQQIEAYLCNSWAGTTPRLYMVVVNDKTLKQVEKLGGAAPCTAYPAVYEFGDLNNATNRAKVEAFIKLIPAGYHVAVISVKSVPFQAFTQSQKDAFKSLGSALIDNLENGQPYALVGRKGSAPGSAQEMSASTTQEINLRVELESKQQSGKITSTVIGPALKWTTLHHTIRKNQNGDDSYILNVYGKTLDGNAERKLLLENISKRSLPLTDAINASEYPYLELEATLSDPTDRTAPQIEEWMVLFDESPEGIIRPDLVEVNGNLLTKQANAGSIKVPMVFQNISSTAFPDSIVVDVTIIGQGVDPNEKPIRLKLAPLAANSSANFEFSMSTLKLSGNYQLRVNVNPKIQPEQHYFNNIYEVKFEVDRKLHPIMDVAFDGVHIMDGELVSPSPVISITVKDQNKYTNLQDPSGMYVKLISPDKVEKEISLIDNPQEVKYFPADEKNDFRLEYKPAQLENGLYTLEVNAKDVTGKSAGLSPYRISFEVENESAITNFFPYPNPFSTKTNFVFTLTGSTIPANMKIQILTVTGKVVKEIMKEEMGPIRIGNNKTEYAWDGTDTFGDKLANGVYLYRVVLSQDAVDMKHKMKKADKAFENGYGKLYILR